MRTEKGQVIIEEKELESTIDTFKTMFAIERTQDGELAAFIRTHKQEFRAASLILQGVKDSNNGDIIIDIES